MRNHCLISQTCLDRREPKLLRKNFLYLSFSFFQLLSVMIFTLVLQLFPRVFLFFGSFSPVFPYLLLAFLSFSLLAFISVFFYVPLHLSFFLVTSCLHSLAQCHVSFFLTLLSVFLNVSLHHNHFIYLLYLPSTLSFRLVIILKKM